MKKLFWNKVLLEGGVRTKQYLKLLNYGLRPYVDEIPLEYAVAFTFSRMEHHVILLARCEAGWMK
jgi:hypothetical protein